MLDDAGTVIGCVYIYPTAEAGTADVRSWVRADHGHLDRVLYESVRTWLETRWPFTTVDYAARD